MYECWRCWSKGNIKLNGNTYFKFILNKTELCTSILLRLLRCLFYDLLYVFNKQNGFEFNFDKKKTR